MAPNYFLAGTVQLAGGTIDNLGGGNTQQNTTFELRGTLDSALRASNCTIRLTGNLECTSRIEFLGCDMYVQGNTLSIRGALWNDNRPGTPGRVFLQGGTINTGLGYHGDGAVQGPGTIDGQDYS